MNDDDDETCSESSEPHADARVKVIRQLEMVQCNFH